MRSTQRARGGILVALSLLTMLGGCGVDSTLAPDPAQYTKDNPPPFLRSPRNPPLFATPPVDLREWYEVATAWVDADMDKTMGGGRYELRFLPGSLLQGAQVVIREWNGHLLEFELGPHGSVFGEPVELTIDFAGTNADPDSRNYDGSTPELYWFNDETQIWEVVPGKFEGRKFHTTLRHFSQYGLARGKSGW